MENYIYSPLISVLISVLLTMGCYSFGKLIIDRFKLNSIISKVSYVEFQYLSFGLLILIIIIFPLVAFFSFSNMILKVTSIILCFLSTIFLKEFKFFYKKIKHHYKDNFFKIFLFIVTLYFLLSLSPLTSADTLDYHVGSALNILRFDKYVLFPEWFTSLQSGTGETLIALGLVIGAEQFGNIVQFSSVLTISGIFLKFHENFKAFDSQFFLPITVLSCPILLFLLSGNKPQIFYSSLLFFALALNFIKLENEKEKLISYFIINILIFSCIVGKFSFNLSGFLIWTLSTLVIVNKKNFYKLILIVLVTFSLIYIPVILWKYINLGGSIFTYFFSPFPLHLPGYENFFSHNKGPQEIPFPYFLFYTTPSRFTEFLGLNALFFIIALYSIKKNQKINFLIIIIFLYILVSNIYASPSARYYLDPILWSTFIVSISKPIKFKKLFQQVFLSQTFVIFLILIYSIINFLPGTFNYSNYKSMKEKYAYMYSGFLWLNEIVPDNSKVIIINRPISQYKDYSISGGFNYFTNEKQAKYYKKLIYEKKPNYIVYFGKTPDLRNLNNCVDKIYKKKDNVGYHATRNPFNKGAPYNGYIYEIDYNKLLKC